MYLFKYERSRTGWIFFLSCYHSESSRLQMDCQATRLQSENIKGTISSIGLFPENRLLLFGSDNGNIELLC